MRRFIVASIVLAAAAAGCGPSGQSGQRYDKMASREEAMVAESAPAVAPEMAEGAADVAAAPPAPGEPPGKTHTLGAPMLAYEYSTGLELPADRVEPTMKAHEKTCLAAGSALCQVLGASTNSNGSDWVSAQLQLRAEPRWLAKFRDGLEADARKADGRIKGSSVTAEDLTREITDTEARLAAQRTLRDRLQALLRDRPGKLADLLETERELARVQGEIDSAASYLAVMRARVAMSKMTLSYETKPNPVTEGAFQPLVDAATGFVGVVAAGFAAVITVFGTLLPWAVVLIPAAWFGLRALRAHRAKKAAERAAP